MPDRLYSRYHKLSSDDDDWAIYWAATARYIGFHYLRPDMDTIFFLDSDEIVEAEAFLEWKRDGLKSYAAQRLGAYLYSVKPTSRCKKVVNLPLLVKKDSLGPLTLLNPLERIGTYQAYLGPKRHGSSL